MVLPTLFYRMYCQDLGPLHLLIVQSNLDSCFSYAHHFCFGKESSDVEELKLLYTFLIVIFQTKYSKFEYIAADTWYQKLFKVIIQRIV